MRPLVFIMTLAVLGLLLLGVAADQPRGAGAEPPQPPTPPPYVITMRSDNGDARMLYRDGWLRTETSRDGFEMVNLSSEDGIQFGVAFRGNEATSMSMMQSGGSLWPTRQRTDRTDEVLGERCNVWVIDAMPDMRIFSDRRMVDCVSEDGIVLWRGDSGRDGLRIHTRAVSLERRMASFSEIFLARERDLLRWDYWAQNFPITSARNAPAYEVHGILQPDVVMRMRGALEYQSWRGRGFTLRSGDASFRYEVGDDHRSISINTRDRRYGSHLIDDGTEPLDRPSLRLFGEVCRWRRVDRNVRWGILGKCLTDDGIELANFVDYHDENHEDEYAVASYFRRGAPDPALMTPPPGVFDPWIAALPH